MVRKQALNGDGFKGDKRRDQLEGLLFFFSWRRKSCFVIQHAQRRNRTARLGLLRAPLAALRIRHARKVAPACLTL